MCICVRLCVCVHVLQLRGICMSLVMWVISVGTYIHGHVNGHASVRIPVGV